MKRSVIGVALLFALSACSSGNGVEVSEAWGRSSPMVATVGAFYMTISNGGDTDDSLQGATSDVCGTIELHESFMKEDGVMGMAQVEGGVIEIPAGETVELKVGGLHIMCIDKQADFELGDVYDLTLDFESAGDVDVEIEIREG